MYLNSFVYELCTCTDGKGKEAFSYLLNYQDSFPPGYAPDLSEMVPTQLSISEVQ